MNHSPKPEAEIPEPQPKLLRSLFVIMPFLKALSRTKADLDAFFKDNIKAVIESDDTLKFRYEVTRSGNALNMTDSIIKSTYDADVVLCDLSGIQPNPNVMYELGMRFSLGDKPVILIREGHQENEKIFDIQGLFTHEFSSTRYGDLQKLVIAKLKDYESDPDSYQSPILKALGKDSQVINAVMKRQMKSMMHGLSAGLFACLELLRRRVCLHLPPETFDSQEPAIFPRNAWDIIAWTQHPHPTMNFSEIDFSPPVIPGMMGLLSFYHFLDVIPKDVSAALYEKLHSLYYHFWAGAALRENSSQENYAKFVFEIVQTHAAALRIEHYLSTDNEVEKLKLSTEAVSLLNHA